MSDKLLFQSGSARLDKRGEEALGKLAEVLNKQTDIDVFIEGHTDNKPINTVQFKDNWIERDSCYLRRTYPDQELRCKSFADTAQRSRRIYAC